MANGVAITSLAQVTDTVIFDDITRAFKCDKVVDDLAQINSEEFPLVQLPITSDGVTFNLGSVNTTNKKLSSGELWGSKVEKDDPEVTFNIADISKIVNGMFMDEIVEYEENGETPKEDVEITIAGHKYKGKGYSSSLKAWTGSLWFPSENAQGWIILPNVKVYGVFNGTDDGNTAFYGCSVTPQQNKKNAIMYLLTKEDE